MIQNLEQALRIIKSTMHLQDDNSNSPYFFIVGAGISVPEIPSAAGIVDMCKETIKKMDPEMYVQYEEETKDFSKNGMKYYSSWIEYAYPNRINRSALFKKLCNESKISAANLMLAQILHSGKFANTVFTTNFDDSIKKALVLMGTKNFFCAENVLDNLVVSNQTKDIQVIHVHGTADFYDCANLEKEIDGVATQTGTISSSQLISIFLANQAPIIVGYSGWENDVIMRCLKERLSYPTPFQYVWVCYDRQSYDNLPNWIKKNDSVIFVVPDAAEDNCQESSDCSKTKDRLPWSMSDTLSCIDARMFFKRIISSFKLQPPLIFSNPYSYYSNEIQSVLPKDEDVLHLRHWVQRLKIVERDDEFEELVQKLETFYVEKDYVEANNVLLKMIDLQLNETNAEFVCTSLIRDFVGDEDVFLSFEDRLNFRLTALAFVEKNIPQLKDIDSLIFTLHTILFAKFRYSEKDKVIELLDRVVEVTHQYGELLIMELTALGIKSNLVDKELKESILQNILERCPLKIENKAFAFVKFKALLELAKMSNSDDSISFIKQAEDMCNMLDKDLFVVHLGLAKAECLSSVTQENIREQWGAEIVDLISNPIDSIDKTLYIEIASYLNVLSNDEIFTCAGTVQIEKIIAVLLSDYVNDYVNCCSVLNYSRCCELACRVTDNKTSIVEFCCKVFDTILHFPHKCESYLALLHIMARRYIDLPEETVSASAKIDVLMKMKNNEYTKSLFFMLLGYSFDNGSIVDFAELSCDLNYLLQQRETLKKGLDLYCEGHLREAEDLFLESLASEIPSISDTAKTDLLYMIRRNETVNMLSFEDLLNQMRCLSEFDIVNALLYNIAHGKTQGEEYSELKAKLDEFSKEQRDNILGWWSDIALVGEEESRLVLSLIT